MSPESEPIESSDNKSAWIVVLGEGANIEGFGVRLDGEALKYQAIEPGHWLLLGILKVGQCPHGYRKKTGAVVACS